MLKVTLEDGSGSKEVLSWSDLQCKIMDDQVGDTTLWAENAIDGIFNGRLRVATRLVVKDAEEKAKEDGETSKPFDDEAFADAYMKKDGYTKTVDKLKPVIEK